MFEDTNREGDRTGRLHCKLVLGYAGHGNVTALAQFDLVRFANERNGGPVHRIVSVMHDGMVELHDLSGYFAPHLFALADDVAEIPPAPPVRHLANVEGGDIVIRITPAALKFATENGPALEWPNAAGDGFRKVEVIDLSKWRDAILRTLRREREDGSTPVDLMLDDAVRYAADQGEEGIDIEGEVPWETTTT